MKTKLWEKLRDSKIAWYAVSTTILAILIYLADAKEFVEAITEVNSLYLSLALISGTSAYLVWGLVWHILFKKIGVKSSLRKSYRLFMAGNFMNSVTPLGQLGGEPFMAYIVSKNTESSYEKSFSAIVSSDLINTIPLFTYTLLILTYVIIFGEIKGFYSQAITAMLTLNFIVLGISLLLWKGNSFLESRIQNTISYLTMKSSIIQSIHDSIFERINETRDSFRQVGEDPKHLLKTAGISHLVQPTQFLSLYLILLGLGVEAEAVGVILTVLLSGLALFSPTPGGTGTIEAAMSGLILAFYPGTALEVAAAASVLYRLTTYWPGIPLGYIALISLREAK